jgi:hypothetical protein
VIVSLNELTLWMIADASSNENGERATLALEG